MKNPRILFLHNRCMGYRKPLFNMFAEKYDVHFFFTDEKSACGLRADYKLLKRLGFGSFKFAPGLLYVIYREKYDLIIFPPADLPGDLLENIACFFAAKIRGKPYLIWSEKWQWKDDKKILIRRFYLAFDRIVMGSICRNAAACISDGLKHAEYLLSLNVAKERIFISPPASIKKQVSESDNLAHIKEKLGLTDQKVILYVGRLLKRKGVNYLIDAFAKTKKEIEGSKLIIIGEEGIYGKTADQRISIAQLKRQSKELGLEVNTDIFFLGDAEEKVLESSYLISNVFVLPGITHITGEPWGLVLNEAMQFGKPIISTDAVGAAYDLIEEGKNGFMVAERDADALHKALVRILSNPALEEKMGDESKRIIRRYSYEDMFEGFNRAIKYALKSNNN
jgi:glycosyltransferase involved in cell wall biosynthesis